MLAWVHTSLASEREFLLSLFGEDADSAQQQDKGSASTAAAAAAAAAAAGDAAAGADGAAPTIAQLLDSVFESICRPLKVGAPAGLCGAPTGLPACLHVVWHPGTPIFPN